MQQTRTRIMTPSRRILLVMLIAVSVAVLGYRLMLVAPHYPGGSLTVAEAFQQAADDSVLLIDIRRPDEWQRTGIPQGAHPIDMRRDDFTQALTELAAADPSRPIALICARGVRSARLSLRLSAAGFDNILDVPEGMLGSGAGPGWLDSGLPTQLYSEKPE